MVNMESVTAENADTPSTSLPSDADAKLTLSHEEKIKSLDKSISEIHFNSSLDNVVRELDKISLQAENVIMGSTDLVDYSGDSSDTHEDVCSNTKKLTSTTSVFSKSSSKASVEMNQKINVDSDEKINIHMKSTLYPPTVIVNDDKDVVYITPDALKFTPTSEHVVATMKNGEKFRFIFCNQEYNDEERQSIENYKRYVISCISNIDKGDADAITLYGEHFKDSIFSQDHYILRYLQGNSFEPHKTYLDVKNHLKWRSENLPIDQKQIEPFLDMGFCYIFGRDKCARPIVVIRLSKASNLKKEVMLRVLYYWLELILSKMLVPGKIEQWRILVDLNSYNIFNMPLSFLKDASKFLTVNYRSRLTGMVILNAPFMVSGIWNVIKGILPVYTQEKIIITSHATSKHFLSLVDESQVEARYGGTAKNNIMFKHPVFPPLSNK
ncbi:CRAL/TRIO domain [Babesia microti strain RI]|uniref:CRAL/TRIO domain n=1 Tax=Babesia microti (strain RI) TaxID=1133968 RepID=A0A1R4AAD9_BABMR|nr:CRAL/TRIO domain [Babesia microti strain RI]SJK85962.1 CRAL/TRIO domain [Babesia microti strain RI]|eukprot:XP_021338165.1 CRAL/TRIO domain [Babesia microti strain RI]